MDDRDARKPGYETRDVDVRGVALFGGVLAAVVLAVLVLMVWMFDGLAFLESRRAPATSAWAPAPQAPGLKPAPQLPPEPRLQNDPVGDLARLSAEEQALLDGYGWVDQPKGVVRIPVERAMQIVVDRIDKGIQ